MLTAFAPSGGQLLSRQGQTTSARLPWTGTAVARTHSGEQRQLRMVATAPVSFDKKTDAMTTYIKEHGGSLPIRKILIANNGMAGTKAILSMRQWCYLEVSDLSLSQGHTG